jgi:UDP-N-acetylglucosamine--N-acetylmuramyl-(pentapeptide) pyrophosphoryl-undecaprenol N-acetylglucosamine transferase
LTTPIQHIEQKKLSFILSGGGTGGHFYPALAIANKLKQHFPDANILFVGAIGKIEMEKAPLSGFPIEGLNIGGFQRSKMLKNLGLPFKILSSLIRSRQIIKKHKPAVVIGTGGYASFPLIYAASRKKIPSLIQEQNFFPGITNKYLAKYVNKVCTVYEGMEKYFPASKIVVTGNPVRESLKDSSSKRNEAYHFFGFDKNKRTLLILGGSLGARTINRSIGQGLDALMQITDIQVLWQCGKIYYDNILERIGQKIPSNVKILPFIDQMDYAYAIADLVVCRAGAISLSELAIVKKPLILIPSPNVAEDHQTKNALSLTEKDAAILIRDDQAREDLIPVINSLFADPTRMALLAENISKFAKPDATENIVKEIIELINKNER